MTGTRKPRVCPPPTGGLPPGEVFPGWWLIGRFPEGDPDGVGAWLLHHGGEAMLLELPPGLTAELVRRDLTGLGLSLKYLTASHGHEDHWDLAAWYDVRRAFREARYIRPDRASGPVKLNLGGEPVHLVRAPKHSVNDQVAIFRGVAMTGDIELGRLASVNDEVSPAVKRRSMAALRDFPAAAGYRVHTVVSAHLNDLRTGVDWPTLFTPADGEVPDGP